MKHLEQCINFINQSPTAFHAVENVKKACVNFIELKENEKWNLEKGKSYIVTRNGSSVAAFSIGKNMENMAFNICASHTDSPTFKLKENSEAELSHALKLNVESYGGMILSTWLDRPLRIAGRVCVSRNDKIETVLYDSKRALCCIPNVAIHLNREINSGFKYNLHTDMMPLFSDESKKGTLRKIICEDLNIREENLLSSDLYLVCDEEGKVWGAKSEFFSMPRIDNLESVYATLQAFLNSENEDRINVFVAFDNEEVGSATRQGADSTFLRDMLKRIQRGLGKTCEEFLMSLPNSMMLSVDNAHALHYNHPELYDPSNSVHMNKGVVIKQNASQSYTTDGITSSIFSKMCKKQNVPVQYFYNKSDIRGGSTLGNIAQSHVSLKSVDIGCAQLAMHSSVETAGVLDVDYMIQACLAFYNSNLKETDTNSWEF